MAIDTKFSGQLTRRIRGLAELALQVQRFSLDAITNIGEATAKKAAQLTPRSDGPGPHVADYWVSTVTAVDDGIRVRVHNTLKSATEPLVRADGSTAPYSLLQILEFGSRAHNITPVRAEFLVFFSKKAGRVVRARSVRHLGTRPYAMMGLSRNRANVAVKKTTDAISVAVRLALSGRASRLNTRNPFGA